MEGNSKDEKENEYVGLGDEVGINGKKKEKKRWIEVVGLIYIYLGMR